MKLTIVTPEHDPGNIPFLLELWDSIKAQTYDNWNWLLYLNNKCQIEHIPAEIKDDPRVTVFRTFDDSKLIGTIKNAAFSMADGDVLVEVDHDDLITPDCLEEVAKAFADPEIGFAYSEDAYLHMTDEFEPYSPEFGWGEPYTLNWKGQDLIAMPSFPPSAQALAYIWYAPDHVRAWRKTVYHEIGGHNPELSICDDHELMIRTYLHTKMKHIQKALYVYRITGDNTWLERNEGIQLKTIDLFREYGQRLAERDADLRGLMKVDIGGGLNPYPGYYTVDLRETADLQADLNEGIPLPDNSVGVLNASHILEHLHDKHKIMSEIHRVLAHGGWAFIEVPSTDGRGAFQDPTHVSYWNENCFLYYTDKYLGDFIDNDTIRFQEFRKETYYPNEWMENLGVLVTTVVLSAVKQDEPRYPHALRI